MTPARKKPSVRREVVRIAAGRCEYCRAPADCSPASFQVEHIEPPSTGGTDEMENLAHSCGGCNGHKGTAVDAVDAETGQLVPLFHPRKDRWTDRFEWDSTEIARMVGRTPTGRATIDRLQLNRSGLTRLRRLLQNAGLHPPSALP